MESTSRKIENLSQMDYRGRPCIFAGREVVRAPTFANAELDKNKLPSAELPEAALLLVFKYAASTCKLVCRMR